MNLRHNPRQRQRAVNIRRKSPRMPDVSFKTIKCGRLWKLLANLSAPRNKTKKNHSMIYIRSNRSEQNKKQKTIKFRLTSLMWFNSPLAYQRILENTFKDSDRSERQIWHLNRFELIGIALLGTASRFSYVNWIRDSVFDLSVNFFLIWRSWLLRIDWKAIRVLPEDLFIYFIFLCWGNRICLHIPSISS